MPAVILSRPNSNTDKVLARSDYMKDTVGLETVTETYTIRTSARLFMAPSRNTLHSSFSESSTKFSRMAVETVSFRELNGDLTEMTVTFVGLTSETGLPPAVVSLIPTSNAGVFGPPVVIQVQYVTDVSVAELVAGKVASKSAAAGWGYLKIPPSINGTPLPPNPREPYSRSTIAVSTRYEGYVAADVQAIPRGLFNLVTINYQELLQQGGTVGSSGFSGGGSSSLNAARQGQVAWGSRTNSQAMGVNAVV